MSILSQDTPAFGVALLVTAILALCLGCDSGGSGSDTEADVAGDWSGNCRDSNGFFLDGFTSLSATNGVVTGTQGTRELTGTIDGRELVLVRQNGQASDGSVLSSTYRATVNGDQMLVDGVTITENANAQIQTSNFECTFTRGKAE